MIWSFSSMWLSCKPRLLLSVAPKPMMWFGHKLVFLYPFYNCPLVRIGTSQSNPQLDRGQSYRSLISRFWIDMACYIIDKNGVEVSWLHCFPWKTQLYRAFSFLNCSRLQQLEFTNAKVITYSAVNYYWLVNFAISWFHISPFVIR